MMRIRQWLTVLLCLLALSTARASGRAIPSIGETRRAALEAAYERFSQVEALSSYEIIVIRRVRRFIVVSFMLPCSLTVHCRGGRMHAVYDPRTDRIVHVLAEDG